jgi:sugar lactone lactonase YvrE
VAHLRSSVTALAAALVAAGGALLFASSPRFFQAAAQADFLRGDMEQLSIDTRGQVSLGPATELVYETAAPFLWSLMPGPDGALFIGTGNEGRVFRVAADGTGSAFFDAAELEAHALAATPDGGLYVGSSPDGKIYRVNRDGTSRVFFEPDEKYIWTMVADPKGTLYAATGDKGVVYRITADGKGTRFYQAKATHVTALALDRSGQLFLGTESPGRVLRVDAEGKAFVLLDSPFSEIRSLRFDDQGLLYVAAVSGGATSSAAPRPDTGSDRPAAETTGGAVPTVTVEVTSVTLAEGSGGSSGGTTSPPREDRRPARGAIYRISPDGLWDQLWESREDAPYDLAFDSDNQLIVATGNRGKIYRLEGTPMQPTLLARAAAQQVTALHRDAKGRIYYATANPGKLFRLSPERAMRGSYESEAHDAGMVATWGAIRWRASVPSGGRIELSTRSGNTPTPDDTWSVWSAPYSDPDGAPITSPKARYLQWRAVITRTGTSPVLTSITAAYLQRNLPPQVASVTVHPPGIVFQKPFSTGDPDLAGFDNQTTPERALTNEAMTAQQGSSSSASLGRRTFQKGLQTLVWRADDENDDDLSFEVRFRREGEPLWKVLRRDLTEPILVWDTTTVPNGTYFVKIVASDAPSNAASSALTGEIDSEPFEIDNTAPQIAGGTARIDGSRTIVSFEVRDDHSPIQRVEHSQDGLRWTGVFPGDGIGDSKAERYEVVIDGVLGPRGLTIRASDALNNVATTQIEAPARR